MIKQNLSITGGSKFPIIHIQAVSGSGKTSLGQRLKKHSDKFSVIELDDIDDPIALELLTDQKYLKLICSEKNKDNDKFFEEKDRLGLIELNKLIEKNKKENKITIITGLSINLETIPITDKYYINIEPEQLFKQYNLRTLDDIFDNYDEIKTLIKNSSPELVGQILLFKYKIRGIFLKPYSKVKDSLAANIKKKKDYKLMTSDEIYDEIINKFG